MLQPYLQLSRPIYILCVGTLVNRAGTFLMFFLTLYLTTDRGYGAQFATIAMGVFGVGSIAANLIGGSLADRYGRRAIMLLSLWGAVVVLLLFGYFTSKVTILGGIFVFALFAEMYRPSSAAMVADLAEPAQRTYAFGLIYLAINMGSGIAALVGGVVAAHYSFQWLFWADAVTTALFAIIIMLTIRETLPARDQQASDELAGTAPGQDSATRSMLGNYVFMIFCFGCLCMGLVYMQSWSTLPLYLKQLGYGADVFGRIISVNPLMIVVLQIPLTSLISRFARGPMVVLSALAIGIGFGATALVSVPLAFGATVVVWTLGEMMQAPLMPSIVSDLAPEQFRARYMGVFTMCFATANVFGAPLGGFVLTHYGGRTLWAGTFVLALFSTLCFCLISKAVSCGEKSKSPNVEKSK